MRRTGPEDETDKLNRAFRSAGFRGLNSDVALASTDFKEKTRRDTFVTCTISSILSAEPGLSVVHKAGTRSDISRALMRSPQASGWIVSSNTASSKRANNSAMPAVRRFARSSRDLSRMCSHL